MLHSALTSTQQAQAARDLFFADALLGFDPADFDYEVDREGLVTGRRARAQERVRRQQVRNQAVKLVSRVAGSLDEQARFVRECALNDLARAVALRLASQQQNDQAGNNGLSRREIEMSLTIGESRILRPVI